MSNVQRPAVPLLRFLGATETVTGSRFLIDTPHARVLIDCGLFQGLKPLRLRNWEPFPIDPASIDAILLTHAHLDHTGYVPALTRSGFTGRIFATEGTRDLSRIVLPDSGHLQEEDAAYANRKGFSKHTPALPLYTEEDGHQAVARFTVVPFNRAQEVASGIRATFRPAGHILGSATITLEITNTKTRRLVFSGDLGRPPHPIFCSPAPLTETDIVVVESTYGDRQHEDEQSLQRFTEAIVRTADRGGMVIIPAFAVDRTEVILFHLRRLSQAKRIPNLPVYVDSPMALASLAIYRQALASGSPELEPGLQSEPDPFDPGNLIEARTVAQSMAINDQRYPSIIISASGMATGGRVLHHLANRLPDHRTTVILVGYQAEGTRGRTLLDGARSVKMLGRYVPVRAEVVNVPAFSVHADQNETLQWLRTAPSPPDTTFIVHGEKTAANTLHDVIERDLGWTAVVPRYLEQVRID
ncbi:MAG: MBL fold metallo-hydrolase RNA specificity domain-containing protein [Candidatus Binatia bacterium]